MSQQAIYCEPLTVYEPDGRLAYLDQGTSIMRPSESTPVGSRGVGIGARERTLVS